MLLNPRTRLGPYEIVSAVGAGGMGEVYNARDTRLNRTVAIKVLRSETAADPERRARFEREARAIASLSHPHICTVHDVGRHEGIDYLVMEYLDGETLADLLATTRGPLPIEQVLTIGIAIADALDKAHRAGIVHRDLKPANVMLTKSGPKLLDFGLAKLRGPATPIAIAGGTTAAGPGTAEGTILGTLHYMAPEQVEGREADTRSDIWALGAVLYEMATGARPFDGDSAASVIGAILKDTPPSLSIRQPLTPPALEHLIERCLEKEPDERWQDAGDVKRELKWIASVRTRAGDEVPLARTVRPASRAKQWLALAAGSALVSLLTAGALLPLFRQRERIDDKPVVRLQLTLPDDVTPVRGQSPAVSPDGTRIALVAVDQASGKRLIYLRPLNGLAAQSARGTDRAIYPFWSPDGGKMGFFADGRLKAVDLATGTVQDVCPVTNPGGPGIWADDSIVFARTVGPLQRVSASGGTSASTTQFDAGNEITQSVAGFLADRRRFIFGANASGSSTFRVGSIDGSAEQALPSAGSRGILHAPWLNTAGAVHGHVLFVRESALFAIDIDGTSAQATGEPIQLAQSISPISSGSALPFSVQDTVLAYVGSANSESRLEWVNRRGQMLGPAGTLSGNLRDVRFSPDGSLVTVSRYNGPNRMYDLMLLDLRRMTTSQLTYGTNAFYASWLHDGSDIFFANPTAKGSTLARIAPREGAQQSPVPSGNSVIVMTPDSSPDGHTLAYAGFTPEGNGDIYVRSLDQPSDPRPFLATPAYKHAPRFSPDGAWIAYQSDETGAPEVFLRAFPAGGDKRQISRGGGGRPVWRHDGKELFYLSPDGDMMAVPITLKPSLIVGPPDKLFRTPVDPGSAEISWQFDVHPDNERFLMVMPMTDAAQPVNVILNWQSLLKK